MRPPLQLLIVSSRIETKRALLRIVEGLPINAFTSSTIERAWEVLMSKPIDVIFCDDRLPDGHYPDFLSAVRSEFRTARFVLMLNSQDWEEWQECLQPMRRGAIDVLRDSYQPTDVELILIRAGREAGHEVVVPREDLHLSATA